MDKIGKYELKEFSKSRKNITVVLNEGWKKHAIHSILEFDVTYGKELIKKHFEKTNEKLSFTAWIVKCTAESLMENKELNVLRQGRKKIIVFEDVDIGIPIEHFDGYEWRPVPIIARKANEKSVSEISKMIRDAQKAKVTPDTQVIGVELTSFEKFILRTPLFLKRWSMKFFRTRGLMKKKHLGTAGVTSIGMKGRFPGTVIPMGGSSGILIVIGGIIKKPWVVNDEITIREILSVDITIDHDLIDGSPLARFVDCLNTHIEEGFGLPK